MEEINLKINDPYVHYYQFLNFTKTMKTYRTCCFVHLLCLKTVQDKCPISHCEDNEETFVFIICCSLKFYNIDVSRSCKTRLKAPLSTVVAFGGRVD